MREGSPCHQRVNDTTHDAAHKMEEQRPGPSQVGSLLCVPGLVSRIMHRNSTRAYVIIGGDDAGNGDAVVVVHPRSRLQRVAQYLWVRARPIVITSPAACIVSSVRKIYCKREVLHAPAAWRRGVLLSMCVVNWLSISMEK